ncbi:MAG: pyridoxal 5'-phosphate synthase glutaminase subunit PdxT [Rectinema sp.]
MIPVRAGVLALQGDYAAHCAALREAGADAFEARSLADIESADVFVLPGGESTVMGSLLLRFGLMDALKARIRGGMPVFGTCAGLILLAQHMEGRPQPGIGLLDVTVRRNAYGTQVDSFRAPVEMAVPGLPVLEGVFIRAPKIVSVGPGVEVLGRLGGDRQGDNSQGDYNQSGDPVLVRSGTILGATFHPELLAGAALHRWFLGFFSAR